MPRHPGSRDKNSADRQRGAPGRLRIVAGNWRSRVLEVADVPGLRPTSERIRETLFNWLRHEIIGARCLDLFAGTGALGLEALSRGAVEVLFVDSSRRAAATLRKNASSLDAAGATIENVDAIVRLTKGTTAPFDIVFLDPPFADDRVQELCRLLDEGHWLDANAKIYVEQANDQHEPAFPDGWKMLKDKKAGNVRYRLLCVNLNRQS